MIDRDFLFKNLTGFTIQNELIFNIFFNSQMNVITTGVGIFFRTSDENP